MNTPNSISQLFLTILVLVVPLSFATVPARADGTFQVSSRTFYVGEVPKAAEEDPDFLPLDRIDWIQDVLDADPIMSRTVFHIFERYYDVRAAAASLKNVRNHGNVQVQGRFNVQLPDDRAPEGYFAFSYRLDNPTSIRLIPKSSEIPFSITCSYDPHMERTHFCSANSSYAYDRFIDLRSRLYSAGDYMENGDFFREVARRMHEIAVCLDVTDSDIDEAVDLSQSCQKPNIS